MKTILITGASGIIGMYVSSSLLQKGNKVIGTDNKPNSFVGRENYTFVQSSITDKAKISAIFSSNKIDTLIHLACSVDNDISSFVTDAEMDDSKACDKFLYGAAVSANVKDILLLSTTQIYAPQKTREPIRETSEEKPQTNYAKMKAASEKAIEKEIKKSSVIPVYMRVAPVYTAEYTQNLRDKVYDAKEDVAFVYKDGEYGFSFCCIFNLVDFINGIILGPSGRYDGIYNICDTMRITAKEIVDYEREHHRIGAVLQKNYSGDAIKSAISSQLNLAKRIKSDYRFLDLSTILNNWSYDNTKAKRISTFRWNLKNTK